MKDQNIAKKIAELIPDTINNVLEVGAGTGVLTRHLLNNKGINLKAVEIDIESFEYLKKNFPELDVVKEDFLNINLNSMFEGEPFAVIGNYPYNISTQIFFKVLDNRHRIPFFAGMFQKEVAERLCANEGSKTYGITSVFSQAFFSPKYLFTVPEHVFDPPPKVKSAVIQFCRKDEQLISCNEKLFFTVVKTAFNQRRKTLRNSLKAFAQGNILSEEIFEKRPEQLSVNKFVELTCLFEKKYSIKNIV